jgi:replicative DNA helicase
MSQPLPHNEISEQYVIGLVFGYSQAETELAARGFQPEWLSLPQKRTFLRVLTDFRSSIPDQGQIDSVALLSSILAKPEILAEIGGPSAITEAANTIALIEPSSVLDYHVETLKTCWQRRRAISLANQLETAAYDGGTFDQTLADTITNLGSISAVPSGDRIINGRDALRDFITDLQHVVETGKPIEAPPLFTRIPELDEKVGGMVPYFWLIGADTSGGKTALSLQLVRAILDQGGRVLVFALEMRARQLIRRLVSAEGKIPIQRLMRPETMNEYDFSNLTTRGSNWQAENLLICDDGDVTIQEVRAIARAQHAKEPLALVLVDYIQLASAGRFREGANREQEISFIGSQCVKMAKELGIPVIAPTQLNDDGKVRESRALKHHAAVYLVIESERILCAKNRDGERDWAMNYKLTGDIQTFEPYRKP